VPCPEDSVRGWPHAWSRYINAEPVSDQIERVWFKKPRRQKVTCLSPGRDRL
jgi:hypothetical protein